MAALQGGELLVTESIQANTEGPYLRNAGVHWASDSREDLLEGEVSEGSLGSTTKALSSLVRHCHV